MIFDTNVLIYLSKYILTPEILIDNDPTISVISKIEALGYNFKNIEEYKLISIICSTLKIVSLSDEVVNETIRLRREFKVKLADAVK